MPRYGRRFARRARGARKFYRGRRTYRRRGGSRRRVASRVPRTVRTMPSGFRAAYTSNRRRAAVIRDVQSDVGAVVWDGSSVGPTFADWYTFDPSGTVGNSNFPSLGAPAVAADFADFVALYKFYKVSKIILTLRMQQRPGQVVNLFNYTARIRWRHDYDFTGAAASSVTWVQDYENVKSCTFSPEAPNCRITLFPRVQKPQFNLVAATGGLTQQGWYPSKMAWTDTSQPVTLYGLRFFFESFPAGFDCVVDVTYHMRFKGRK